MKSKKVIKKAPVQKRCTCITKTNKTVAAVSFTRKKFSFKTSDFALNQTSTRYFQSVSAHSTMSQKLFLKGCIFVFAYMHAECFGTLSRLINSHYCLLFASHLINMATDAARLTRYPECNNPHVLICMQFIVNLSTLWLPPVYSLISNEGIKTPSLIARHLKQRIYKPSQLWLHFSWFRTASKGEKVWKWMIWWQAALKTPSESWRWLKWFVCFAVVSEILMACNKMLSRDIEPLIDTASLVLQVNFSTPVL